MEPKSAPPLDADAVAKLLSDEPIKTEPKTDTPSESTADETTVFSSHAENTEEPADVPADQSQSELPAKPVVPEQQPVEDALETPETPAPAKTKRSHKRAVLVAAIVILNLGLVGANIYIFKKPAATHADNLPAKTTAVTPPEASTTTTKVSSTTPATDEKKTLHYVSKPLNLEFDYPVSWRISSNSDNTSMNVSSEPFTFTDTAGKAALSTIKMFISTGNTNNDAFSYMSDSDVIYADSEALSYTSPTTVQRKQTNLSFAGYAEKKNDGINSIFVSGTNVYKKGNTVGSKDYKKVDPHISLYVDGCSSGKCQALIEAPFSINDWHTNPELLKAKAIIESLKLN